MLRSDYDFKNDDDSNLSDMINEYSQDNELRRKIDKLKKQKEEENLRRKVEDDVYRNSVPLQSNFTPVKETPNEEKASNIPDIRYDDTMIDKTRVGFQPEDDSDKTLVIMNRKQGGFDFQHEQVIDPKPLYEDEDDKFYVDEEEEDEVNDTQEHTFTLDEEENDEEEVVYAYEDEEDDDEDDKRSPKRSKVKDDADNRINKIITGVIVGIVGLCVIAGAFFGIKYLLGSSSDTDPKKDPVEETKEPVKEPETPIKEPEEKPEDPDITDNDAKISKIKGTIKTLEGELSSVNSKISQAENKISVAKRGKETTSSDLNKAIANYGTTKSDRDKASTVLTNANTALEIAKQTFADTPEGPDKAQASENLRITQEAYDSAKRDFDTKEKAFKTAEADNKEKNASYEPKMSTYDKEIKQATEELDKLKKQKTEIEQKIADENTKLNDIH